MNQITVKATIKMYAIKMIFIDKFLIFLWENMIQ